MWLPSRRVRLRVLRRFGMKIGKGTFIARNVEIKGCGKIEIGDNCVINTRVLLDGRGAKLIIGNNVDIAQEATIWTLEHDPHTHEAVAQETVIEDYVWIGNKVTILPGARIGKDSICAACALITKDVPENSIVGGVPAKVIGQRNRTIDYRPKMNTIFR